MAKAQEPVSAYWVAFTDKVGTPFSVERPQDFLSSRAIERRARQQIPIAPNDLPVNPSYIAAVRQCGATVLSSSRWFNGVVVYYSDAATLAKIQALTFVKSTAAVTRYKQKILKTYLSADNRTQPENTYGASYRQVSMLQMDSIHLQGYRAENMVIAVMDAGFDNAPNIPHFSHIFGKGLYDSWDFVQNKPLEFTYDTHGSNVLGCMGANLPGEYIGTAPMARFALFRTENVIDAGNGSELLIEEYNWVAAAERADSLGADVLNTSLGYSEFSNSAFDHSYQQMDGNTTRITQAADIAASKGMLVVVSAGNQGNSAWKYITAPADADSTLTVGAVDSAGIRTGFSSQGPTADGRIKPNVMAQGGKVAVVRNTGEIGISNGTSFSGPIIAGAAACLWQAHPKATNMELLRAIEQSASRATNPDSLMGYGIPNFAQAKRILDKKYKPLLPQLPLITVNPNPFDDNLLVYFDLQSEQYFIITIYDILGKKVFEQNLQKIPAGSSFKHLTLPTLFRQNTPYLVVVQGQTYRFTKMLLHKNL